MAEARFGIKALTFDVFGTAVDWRSSIIREGEAIGRARGLAVDWARFADAWREGYAPAMERVRQGELPWTKLDGLHRMILDGLLEQFRIQGFNESDRAHFNRVWHRLAPWPDAVPGLARLRARFVVAALSNGNMALLVDLSKHGGLSWDCILSADLVRHYKPDPEVYQMAADLLDLPPRQIMMVAAHTGDLRAAAAVGFQTALVLRPREWDPVRGPNLPPEVAFHLTAQDFNDLADQLGA